MGGGDHEDDRPRRGPRNHDHPLRRGPGDKEELGRADFAIAEAKYWASNAAWEAVDRAVQVFGGRGWSELYRPFRHLQDVRVCRIYEGTDEIMQLKIASSLLGKEFAAFG